MTNKTSYAGDEGTATMTFNIDSPALKGLDGGNSEQLSKAVAQRMLHKETYEEAWARVFAMKNSDRDNERLQEVKTQMDAGKIGRPRDKVNKRFSKAEALAMYSQIEEQQRIDRLTKMVEETPDNYELVTDEQRLDEVVDELLSEELVVFDVETTGTDIYEDIIVGHVLSATSKNHHYYVPTDHKDESMRQLDRDYVAKKLRPIYESETIGLIAHNAKFDRGILKINFGITTNNIVWDTLEAAKLLNENEQSYALKPLVTKYLRDTSYTYGELFGDIGFDEVDLKTALAYAAKDGDVSYRLYEFQRYHMQKVGNIYEYFTTVEMPLLTIVSDIELRGYDIDTEYASEVADRLRAEADELEKAIVAELNPYYKKAVGDEAGDINIGSPTQLRQVIEVMTEKPAKSSDKNTLKKLAKEYAVFGDILKYRDLRKLLSTYYEALPKLVREKTGKVHTVYNQNGAKTGRFSSGGQGSFNIQNQSPEAMKMFVVPDDKVLVTADFSAQEVRIIAALSKEDVLIDAFARGVDAYATLASEFFGKPYEECYKLPDGSDTPERLKMKVVLLMSMYGASKFGLAQALSISEKEAEQFLEDFFKKYTKIASFIEETHEHAKKYGYVWIGDKQRKRRLPEAQWKREFIPYGKWNDPKYEKARIHNSKISKSMRQSPNSRVQGLGAIQTKKVLIAIEKESEERDWEIWTTRHDDISVLMNDDETLVDNLYRLNDLMVNTYLLDGVANKTDIELQKRWSNSISFEDYLAGKPIPRKEDI